MARDPSALGTQVHDLVVVGGGIFGACVAWEAARRGLSVALLERGDFCGGTSANSFKMVHGGIRYLQHADLVRVRESCAERSALLRLAPHLVRPLPILIPTYGHGRKGKLLLGAGMGLYDLITFDRNRGIADPARRIPRGRFLSRAEVLAQFPDLDPNGLTGGALFHDGQMYNPPRLALAFLRSAWEAGARMANYLEATEFLREGGRVAGVRAVDRLDGGTVEVRGRVVVNAAGPWAESILGRDASLRLAPKGTYSRDACFLVRRRFPGPYAIALPGTTRDPDALFSREARHMFLVPWRDYTLVGVWHVVHGSEPDDFTVTDDELAAFVAEMNTVYPSLKLTLDDVCLWNAGLVPFGENDPNAKDLRFGKRSRLVDHAVEQGIEGLITLIGIRYTMARGEAARAVDLAARKLGRQTVPVGAASVFGGDIPDFEALVRDTAGRWGGAAKPEVLRSLCHNHGTAAGRVLALAPEVPGGTEAVAGSHVLGAEVNYAVREEMAVRLADVVLRRTDLGSGGDPGDAALEACAARMAAELGWDAERTRQEVEAVRKIYPNRRRAGAGAA